LFWWRILLYFSSFTNGIVIIVIMRCKTIHVLIVVEEVMLIFEIKRQIIVSYHRIFDFQVVNVGNRGWPFYRLEFSFFVITLVNVIIVASVIIVINLILFRHLNIPNT
jgi:hypothetical protein